MTPSLPFSHDSGYWRQIFQLNSALPETFLENLPFTPGDAAARVENELQSRRYPEYIRVHNREYRKALVKILRRDAAGLVDLMWMREDLDDLDNRIQDPKKEFA